MKAKIHRIAIAVADINEAVPRYERLFDTKFDVTGERVKELVGVIVAASWDAGVELVQPVKGSTNPLARDVQAVLDRNGESVCGAGFQVDNMEEAIAIARKEGIEPYGPTFSFTQEQLDEELGGKFTYFAETALKSHKQIGFLLVLNNITEKH